MLAAAVGAREERVFAVQSDPPDRAFDDVGVDIARVAIHPDGCILIIVPCVTLASARSPFTSRRI